MYTIGQVSKMMNIPISTLRYYDNEGLFPNIERKSGIRKFSDTEIDALHLIECLKKSGLEIKEIKQFMEWCAQGSSTYQKRLNLFLKQKKAVEEEMQRLQETMDMLDFKVWYYTTAIQDNSEDHINEMIPNNLPDEIQDLYDRTHKRNKIKA